MWFIDNVVVWEFGSLRMWLIENFVSYSGCWEANLVKRTGDTGLGGNDLCSVVMCNQGQIDAKRGICAFFYCHG